MGLVEEYITELRDIHGSNAGVKETSYYPAISNLLNGIGRSLSPEVRCIMMLRNLGAGMPDGGLFTPDQFLKESDTPMEPQNPARGVVEVKGTKDDAWIIADGEQVTRYWGKYRQVLVTNLRDWVLVGQDVNGQPVKLEKHSLASSEQAFWNAAKDPRKLAQTQEGRFVDFLKRVLLQSAPLTSPQDVAWFLASYAREARARVAKGKLAALKDLRAALEHALGFTFEGGRGDHFFQSTLVQTLFYGVFSAWVLWSREPQARMPSALFHWEMSARTLRVPMIRALFEQVAMPTKLEPLGLVDVLDWTAAALNRVDRDAFFARFEDEHAVQYFYEPFLQAFDPELRKQLGVWYTPPEVARYMVERVDTVLREELDRPDGLADRDVYVLDASTGTATYLVEALKRIAKTFDEQGEDALAASEVKEAAMKRVFGFEILPAPFVVAHLQVGLLLQRLGAPLSPGANERAGIYLTNALTGWEPSVEVAQPFLFPELEMERDAAGVVKQKKPILVMLGNPPYNAFAGVSPTEEDKLVDPYKVGLNTEWGIKKYNLDDLYVRFFRLAERRIAEQTGQGVVCYISNFSYLSDPSFVVMRQRFLEEFDALWFDSLNGDSRETGKLTPDGQPDPSIFSTEYNREGIRVGTAIGLMVRKSDRLPQSVVRYRQFWGVVKRADLLASLDAADINEHYGIVTPLRSNRFSFRSSDVEAQYLAWPRVVDLCVDVPISGLQEMRRGSLMDVDPERLAERMRLYYDPTVEWSTLQDLKTGLTHDGGGFDAKACRTKVLASESFDQARIQRYALYPFDRRWCYHSNVRPLWNRSRPALASQSWEGNTYFVARMLAERPNERIPVTVTNALPDYHLLRPNVVAIPMRLRHDLTPKSSGKAGQMTLPADDAPPIANLSTLARSYLASLGVTNPDADADTAGLIWMHALSIGNAPAYLAEYSGPRNLDSERGHLEVVD